MNGMAVFFLGFAIWCCLMSSVSAVEGEQIDSTLTNAGFKNSRQLLIVRPIDESVTKAVLLGYTRQEHDWGQSFGPVQVSIGRNGFAPIGEKTEGDGRSPSGIFRLGHAFGYAPSASFRIPYRQATVSDVWVDDPASPVYNTWVHGKPDASSYEEMRRQDHLYQWGIVIEYNTTPVLPGKGSAIFIHLWREPFIPTAGCVAMSEENMLALLSWLDAQSLPVICMGRVL